jgi:spermidine/putrescine transport system permease protein
VNATAASDKGLSTPRRAGNAPGRLFSAFAWLVYAFLYLPLAVVILNSFNASRFTTRWEHFTLDWYKALFANASLMDAALNSLLTAASSATLATILGGLAALCLRRYRFTGRGALHACLYILAVSPDIVMGISLLIFFIVCNFPLGFQALVIAHATLALPFVALTVIARMAECDEQLIEAARDLGATEFGAYRHILLPLIAPALAAGWLLSFTVSLDDVMISVFVTNPPFEVLPVKIYSMVRLGVKPDINALSAIMFAVTLLCIGLAQFFIRIRRR